VRNARTGPGITLNLLESPFTIRSCNGRAAPGTAVDAGFASAGESLSRAFEMAKRLYVGNLGYTVGSEELQELFGQYGQVKSAQVLNDRETGRSRGFGFVEMDDDTEADAAVQALDGNDYEGRRLNVNEAKPRTPGGAGGGGGGRGGYGGGGGGGYDGGRGGY